MILTAERLRELLDYDPDTGLFSWRSKRGPRAKTEPFLGWPCAQNCRRICVDGKPYLAHRLAWLHIHGEWPKQYIDHIDGDRSNNKLANLREATPSQNQQNRKPSRYVASGLKGAYYRKDRGNYQSRIGVGGKSILLGTYRCPTAAHLAYCVAAKKLFGEFWRGA